MTKQPMCARIPATIRYTRDDPRIEPCPYSGCWKWTRGIMPSGYGRDKEPSTHKTRYAHRLVWETIVGPIPKGLVLDHVCRVRNCVNPDHLRVVTPRENVLADGSLAPTKANADKSSCPKCGGAYQVDARGERMCRACKTADERARFADPEYRARRNAQYRARRSRTPADAKRIVAMARTGGTE